MSTPARSPRGGDARTLVEGEFRFTDTDFEAIARMLYDDAGIFLTDTKVSLVYSRLAKRLRVLGLGSFADYCSLVAGKDGIGERQNMLAALTTNVTRFFREQHHFDHLRDKLLPDLVALARSGGRVRFWSAGCSTGQEPYSIALTVLEAMPDAAGHDVRILASDIDPNVVQTGRRGLYSTEAVKPVPPAMRDRWMQRVQDGHQEMWQVGEEMRRLVAFRELNLMGHWPMKGRFHAIFCRNVVIYFDDPTQARIWQRFAPMLFEGGRLYVGHSERVTAMEHFASDGLTAYRLKDGRR